MTIIDAKVRVLTNYFRSFAFKAVDLFLGPSIPCQCCKEKGLNLDKYDDISSTNSSEHMNVKTRGLLSTCLLLSLPRSQLRGTPE